MRTRPPVRQIPEGWDAEFAALSQQVINLEGDYKELKLVVVNLDKKIDAAFAALTAKFDAKNITPWPTLISAIGIALAGMSTIGYLSLQPLRNEIELGREAGNRIEARQSTNDYRAFDRLNVLEKEVWYLRGKLGFGDKQQRGE